jgi:hypothetical protein
MPNHAPKVVVSGRVLEKEKQKLQKSGYTVAETVTYFNKQYCEPVKALEIDIDFLNREIFDLKMEIISKEMRLEELQKNLEKEKMKNPEFYPEIKLKKLAADFLHQFSTSPYYDGVELVDALELARKGLSRKCRDIGFSFKELEDMVLKLSTNDVNNEVYISAKNL